MIKTELPLATIFLLFCLLLFLNHNLPSRLIKNYSNDLYFEIVMLKMFKKLVARGSPVERAKYETDS